MKKAVVFACSLAVILWFGWDSVAQFTPEEVAEFEKWEKFLEDAEIVGQQQLTSGAVTEPWRLTLEMDGTTRDALWKNPEGRQKGFLEGWKWEIAAYRLSKHLGLDMVPPTVEKRFRNDRGSCQLWIGNSITLKYKEDNNIKTPSHKIFWWNRALYLQRAFDNLIANEDRHQNQFLIIRDEEDFQKDFRMILIDHSRTFRTSKKFLKLIYDEKYKEGPRLMNELPREFFEKLKGLTAESIKEIVGEYLTDDEIEAVLVRRDLIVDWVNNRIKKVGEDKVLY